MVDKVKVRPLLTDVVARAMDQYVNTVAGVEIFGSVPTIYHDPATGTVNVSGQDPGGVHHEYTITIAEIV